MKKVLSLLLSLLMLFSITAGIDFSAYALASSGKCGDNATWSFDSSTGTLTISGTGDVYDYNSPFKNNKNINSVIIKDGITSIGNETFSQCSKLKSAIIPNSLKSIGDCVFEFCSSLKNVKMGSYVESIGHHAFSHCLSLINLKIPYTVMTIGEDAFSHVNNIFYNGTASGSPWGAKVINGYVDGYLVYADERREELLGCSAQATYVTIPNSVKMIGKGAFSQCSSLSSIVIPNSVKMIGIGAFSHCSSLSSIVIPDSVTSIGYHAFEYCTSLTNIIIPNSISIIESAVFTNCTNLTSITIPNNVSSIGDFAFGNCNSLKSVIISNCLRNIGEYAFFDCSSLTDVYYTGSETQWNNISIGSYNDRLIYATIHYNYLPTCDVHTVVTDKAVAPTCTEPGLTQGSHCSVCEKIIVPQEIVKPTGHKYDSGKITKAATCKATGVKTYTCTVCKATKTATIAKTAHTYKNYVTKATSRANGSIVNKCSVCGTKKSTTVPKVSSFKLSATNYTYDGKVKTPAVTVKDSKGKTLRKGTDYDVTYSSGRKNVGKYAVKITLKGNYYGTKTLYFNINPRGTTIAKLTPKSRAIAVQWKKQTNQTTGYQIQYSVYSNFKSAKTITMPKNTYYAKSITGLSGNKRYYVRIRTYKTVKFNGKNYNLYSPWSSTKYTTTKK